MTTADYALRQYSRHLKDVRSKTFLRSDNDPFSKKLDNSLAEYGKSQHTDTPIAKGWAQQKRSKTTRFTQKVKRYLDNVFDEGDRTNRKKDPYQVELDILCLLVLFRFFFAGTCS